MAPNPAASARGAVPLAGHHLDDHGVHDGGTLARNSPASSTEFRVGGLWPAMGVAGASWAKFLQPLSGGIPLFERSVAWRTLGVRMAILRRASSRAGHKPTRLTLQGTLT